MSIPISASPIIAAFQRAERARQAEAPDSDVEVIDDIDESKSENPEPTSEEEEEEEEPQGQVRKRRLQHVVDARSKARVVRWMIETHDKDGVKHLMTKTVQQFPMQFRGQQKANLSKASDWWKKRHAILTVSRDQPRTVQHRQRFIRRVMLVKAGSGRGRKRSAWVEWLQPELLEEFQRLKSTGLQFSNGVLVSLAVDIIKTSDTIFNEGYLDPSDGKPIIEKIDWRWVQVFMERHNIVIRKRSGKHQPSAAKVQFIERSVAYHLGEMQRAFESGELDEDDVENIDETHFVINMDNGLTLGFAGDDDVKYADVVSGGEGMTMVVRITGGANAKIAAPFMIFKNKDRNYPIRGTPDDIPGVSYRTAPKGFVDRALFAEYFREKRAHCRHKMNDYERIIYLDNCGGHNETVDLVESLDDAQATLRFLPENATDLCQPADSFVISKLKQYWRAQWNLKKIELIRDNNWSDRVRADGTWSGKLQHPGKSYFLKLAADSVRAVNEQRDENGMTYARKAMIRCGLALDTDGIWRVEQLFPHLQTIVNKYRANFDGDEVTLPGDDATVSGDEAS